MAEHDRAKLLALAASLAVLIVGEPAFYVFLIAILLHSAFRPSTYLVLLFFSGLLKNSELIRTLPVDFTLLVFLLFAGHWIYQWASSMSLNKNAIVVIALIVVIFCVVLINLFRTPAPWSYVSNSGIFIVVLYLPLLFMIITLPSTARWKILTEFHRLSLLIAYPWIALGLHNEAKGYFPPQVSNPEFPVDHMSAFGEDYMAFATFIVLVFADAIVQFLYGRRRLLHGSLIIVLTYALVNSPARGLTLGLVAAVVLLTLLWFRRFSLKKILLFSVLSTGILAFIVYYINLYSEGNKNYLIRRLVDFDPTGTSISNRIASVLVAFRHWRDGPWFGTGTDSVAWFNQDPGFYSHNLFLEILFEYGILGGLPLFALLGVLFLSFFMILKHHMVPAENVKMLWFGALFIVFFGFGMFSGTLGNMRLLWILMGLSIGFGVLDSSHAASASQFDYPFNSRLRSGKDSK